MTSRFSLFPNQYKKEEKHPDVQGTIHITVELITELAWRVQNNQGIEPGYGPNGKPGVNVKIVAWDRPYNPQTPNGPVLTGSLESPTETQRRAGESAARKAAGEGAPQGYGAPQPGYGAPQGYGAPAPVVPAPVPAAPAPPYGQQAAAAPAMAAPVPPAPAFNPATGQWGPPAAAVAPVPPAPVFNPATGQWVLPGAPAPLI